MKEISRGRVVVYVPDEMIEWPGHRRELMKKIEDLNAFIYSLDTGSTEPWR
jgi:hypothetical protein